jgi:MFS family permease
VRPLLRLPIALFAAIARLAAIPASGLLAAAPLSGGRRVGPSSLLRRSLRACTSEGIVAEVIGACAGTTALTGWALHLGASPLEVGIVGALPQLAQVVQLPAAWVTSTFGRRRAALLAVAVSRQALLPLAVLPFLPSGCAGARALLLAVAAFSAALGVLGNNAWTAWMGDLVPEGLRGRYFGRRTAVCTLGGTLAGLGAARILDAAGPRHQTGPALALLAIAACACGVVTTVLMARQHEPAAPASPPPTLEAALRPLRDPDARRLLAYQLAWNAAVGVAGGYFTFFLLHDLRAGFTVAALHAAAGAVARLVSAPLWGRAVDRFGARPVLAACSFAVAGLPLAWLATTPDRLWPIAIDALVGGVAWGGHALASFAMPLTVAPRRDRPFYLASFSLAGGLGFAGAAAAGGAALAVLPRNVAGLGLGGSGLAILMVVSAASRLASAFLALRIPEPGAGTLLELHQAARGAARVALTEARVRVVGRREERRGSGEARRRVG